MIVNLSACNEENDDSLSSEDINYKQEMRNFVQEISIYAKSINPKFLIIPQNGVNLISTTGDEYGAPDINYINAIDGIGQEDLFYGYDEDDKLTKTDETDWLINFLDIAKETANIKIMVTDYCYTHKKMYDSYLKNNSKNYISFSANSRELNNIPTYPNPIYNENPNTIKNLQDAKNFLYLISPDDNYPSKQEFINAIKKTNYDVIIIDFFYDGEEFTKSQIEELKQKPNGEKRLLISYMSIGEAENYRYYWNPDWTISKPPFLEKENPNWKGNYIVKYWTKSWQNIIFGNNNSYLKKILDAGFNGVYLDIIDAFEYFEDKS